MIRHGLYPPPKKTRFDFVKGRCLSLPLQSCAASVNKCPLACRTRCLQPQSHRICRSQPARQQVTVTDSHKKSDARGPQQKAAQPDGA